ncbi:MAG: Gfo/Idh/MocA family oxidoreductase [Streptococcaceae bacterium]|jgi:predicted dehydrogenase|nr:Gfo/Idh/MocA family oxidoreductase [Streptococcaceae bacterium]
MTLKLGVIGTSWISQQFIEAAHASGSYELTAVYSRTLARAAEFSSAYDGVSLFETLDSFFEADFDVVYIASPNSEHFSQSLSALTAGKHVIVEKPAFSNSHEFEAIQKLSADKKRLVFEAARHIHESAFETVKKFLSAETIVGADLTYAKYSSKMPALLAGELSNKWNSAMSGGILADLGVYLLYFALGIFGRPANATYAAKLLPSGVDVSGIGVLNYETFNVALKCGGNLTSYLPSEIYTTRGTLILDGISAIRSAKFITFDGSETQFALHATQNPMEDEARAFAEILRAPQTPESQQTYASWTTLAREVCETSYVMRQSAKIRFEADFAFKQ